MADEAPGGVVKVVELVGSSPSSFSDAVRNAVRTASKTIRNIQGVDVIASSAQVDAGGNLVNYKVDIKLAFLVEDGNVTRDDSIRQPAAHREDSTSGAVPNVPSEPLSGATEQSPFGNPPPTGGGTTPVGPS
jgi:flavin-binding protein dodecin